MLDVIELDIECDLIPRQFSILHLRQAGGKEIR